MIVRMNRLISQDRYLRELSESYGSVDKLQRLSKRQPEKFPLVEEWKFLLRHPERAAETLSIQRELVFHDFERFLEVITPQRLRLLEYLRTHPGIESLNELARRLGRDYRNVYDDVKDLASTGVIDLESRTNRVVPRVIAESIEVSI